MNMKTYKIQILKTNESKIIEASGISVGERGFYDFYITDNEGLNRSIALFPISEVIIYIDWNQNLK